MDSTSTSPAFGTEKLAVILDTDIGSDIDDAVALAYLLRQPRCELVGVTTVSGGPEKRASLADAICRAAERTDVPIHVGVELPLLVAQHQPHVPQFDALEKYPHSWFKATNTAVQYLRDTIRARPGEITLLAIGPLTNIGLLFALDREIPSLLKQLVLMGGNFLQGSLHDGSEWNILCDPQAAAIVFAAPVPRLVAVGLDVTLRCTLPAAECRERFRRAGGPLEVVGEMAEVWFRERPEITFHDPLAASLIFEPTLCELTPGHVSVDQSETAKSGTTYFTPVPGGTASESAPVAENASVTAQADGKHPTPLVAKTVDTAGFFGHYFGVVGG